MCTGAEFAAAFAAAASTANTVATSMKSGPDPALERAKAEAEASQLANGKISMQRKAMRDNSLLTGAGALGGGMASTGKASAGAGRTTLGV